MADTPDYAYQNWLQDAYITTTTKKRNTVGIAIFHEFEKMNDELSRIIEILEKRARISPS